MVCCAPIHMLCWQEEATLPTMQGAARRAESKCTLAQKNVGDWNMQGMQKHWEGNPLMVATARAALMAGQATL